jgi:hypothetical protein
MSLSNHFLVLGLLLGSALAIGELQGRAVSLQVHSEIVGNTPEILGVNSGHFATGSNTMSRVRYLQPNGMRIFINGNHFVSKLNNRYDMEPWGDGVDTRVSFEQRRLSLRDNPMSSEYIDWNYYEGRLANYNLSGINVFSVPHVLDLLTKEGIGILSQTTISKAHLGFDNVDDWSSRWEYWKFYYAYAYLMVREYGIHYFQMYNEPNHSASGIDDDFPGYLERLKLASDAIQSAIADFNAANGKDFEVKIMAPVLAGLNQTWSNAVSSELNVPLVSDGSGFDSLFHSFSYQQYNQTGPVFGNNVNTARSIVQSASGRQNFPVAVTEFNVHTNATFSGMAQTLDSPDKFSRLGSIYNGLILNSANQLYVFKLNQTDGRDTIGIRKNGLAYVDNQGGPYDNGGLTGGFEVSRLYNEAFAGSQKLLKLPSHNVPNELNAVINFIAARKIDGSYRLAIANESSDALELNIDFSGWGLSGDELLVIEEVSSNRIGEIALKRRVGMSNQLSILQPARSVWMIKILPVDNLTELTRTTRFAASFKGDNSTVQQASTENPLRARHHLSSPSNRSVILLDYDLGYIAKRQDARAYLQLRGNIEAGQEKAIYHVYSVRDGWRPDRQMTWNDVPHLRAGNQAIASPRINASLIGNEEEWVQLVGTFRATSSFPQNHRIDVTDVVRRSPYPWMVFMISRDIRNTDDETVNTSSLVLSDFSSNESFAPHLQLFLPEGSADTPFSNISAEADRAKSTGIGSLWDGYGPYVYHMQLGWLLPFPTGDSFWAFQPQTGEWYWLNESVYPWTFNFTTGDWKAIGL